MSGDEGEQRAKKSIQTKEQLVECLDPFVEPLLESFKTFHNPVIVQTLAIMIHVVHLGLPTFKTLLKKFLTRILRLFENVTAADAEFLNSLFKCTSELIRTYSVYNDLSEI